jgi:cell wall-associated NlpC family hydrolase
MPRRPWRWAALLATCLVACAAGAIALVLAGAATESAAPRPAVVAPVTPSPTTVSAAERRQARRAAAARRARAAARRQRVRLIRTTHRATVAARHQIGTPYAWGGTGPGGFDCSGLTRWALARVGVHLPHSSFAQAQAGRAVGRGRVRPGDLVFFSTAGPGASHVGIALSRSTVVSATSTGVRAHSISDDYWGPHYVGARRVITRA